MLDHIERRTFLVQPARKYPFPRSVGLGDIKLDESPRQPFILPRSGRIAGPQADNRIAHADRLARFQREIADDAVALVEQPKHCDALAHWRYPGHWLDRLGHVDGHGLRALDRLARTVATTIAARAKRCQRNQDKATDQDYSGFHA